MVALRRPPWGPALRHLQRTIYLIEYSEQLASPGSTTGAHHERDRTHPSDVEELSERQAEAPADRRQVGRRRLWQDLRERESRDGRDARSRRRRRQGGCRPRRGRGAPRRRRSLEPEEELRRAAGPAETSRTRREALRRAHPARHPRDRTRATKG